MDEKKVFQYVDQFWNNHIVPALMSYIKIPNQSPQFDKNWETNGYMDQAVQLIAEWCQQHAVKNMQLQIIKLKNRTPVIFIEVPGDSGDTILLYGHLDKQPEMSGWEEGLHPWQPVLREDKLYGRGGADDGYAAFASLAAIKALQEQNVPHARCLILIEASEESGSCDLPYYIEALESQIGVPKLIVCLDSGCGNYEQLWVTTSLRGLIGGTLSINVLKQGIHSGNGSGVAPASFRILRQLINRIENESTGDIILKACHVDIPEKRIQQASKAANILGESIFADLAFLKNVQPESISLKELVLRRTWKPALSLVGCDGLPAIQNAGNVTLPSLAVKLSLRLPPTCDPVKALKQLKIIFESDPPYQADIKFNAHESGAGWQAPIEEPWLIQAAHQASLDYFGKEAVYMGEGGSIPFMGMLGKKFPKAQFLITGVLGPASNAHGPNEFLHIPTGKKLTACVSKVIAAQYENNFVNK